jgi:hypothetical protein
MARINLGLLTLSASCAVYLIGWLKGSQKSMPFGVPVVWREQKDHLTDCYFRLTKISETSLKSKHSIQYPSLPSAVRPVLHSQDLPVLNHPKNGPLMMTAMMMSQSLWNRTSAIQTFSLLHQMSASYLPR